MNEIRVFCDCLEIALDTGPGIRDITGELDEMVRRSGTENGCLYDGY